MVLLGFVCIFRQLQVLILKPSKLDYFAFQERTVAEGLIDGSCVDMIARRQMKKKKKTGMWLTESLQIGRLE